MKRIIIVGGGFGGARVARKLRNKPGISVTLINDSPDFRYSPAMYRAATGYKMGIARLPLEWMLIDSSNIELVVGSVKKVHHSQRFVELASGEKYEYDYVVFSLGSVTSYFGIKGLEEHSYGVKSPQEIMRLRKHLHAIMLRGHITEHNVVIAGGGPTGVEMAGAMKAYLNRIAKNHRIKSHHIKVSLVEAAPRLLPTLHPQASKVVEKRLKKSGINLLLNTRVKSQSKHKLHISEGTIETETVIWTAGTTLHPFYYANINEFSFSDRHKIMVDQRLQARPNMYVIGDNAATEFSGTALTAVQHGSFVAKDIIKRIANAKRPDTYSEHPVYVIPVGRAWAILQYRSIVLRGRVISWIRKFADYMGYSDVLGHGRALTIWSHEDVEEFSCQTCQKYKK